MRARRWGRGAAAVVTLAALGVLPSSVGQAATAAPTVTLRGVLPHVTAVRFLGEDQLFFSPGVYVAAVNGAFELDAVKAPSGAVAVYPTRRDADGTVHRGPALRTPAPVSMGDGLPAFFTLTLSQGNRKVSTSTMPFCPGNWGGSARVDSSGPDRPTFPYFCGSTLTKATVWGLDRGWASPTWFVLDGTGIADGEYTLGIGITGTYARQLAVPSAGQSVSIGVTLTTDSGGGCKPGFPCVGTAARSTDRRTEAGPQNVSRAESAGNTGLTADTGGLPNLQALPAHDLVVENIDGRDQLEFGATMWNSGSGPLVLEGFRQGATETMTAQQFIYRNGVPGAPTTIGTFEYDRREGHMHWHVEDAAQYDLLDASGQRVLLSDKQSFCLAPTDPIDLTQPGADWQPDRTALWSQCAGEDSIWLREVMPAGWGDTYFQYAAGQSFDITDLPNGSYQLRVTTNPLHRILETSYGDNVSLLPVTLGGTPGARTVS